MKRRKPRPRALQLAVVHWIDAAGDRDGEDVRPIHAATAGFIVADEPDFIRVAGEIFEDGSYRDTTAIPKGMIRAVIGRKVRLPDEFEGWLPN